MISPDNFQAVVGKTVEEAKIHLSNLGYVMRVIIEDGQQFSGTTEYREDRVKVEVANGVVTAWHGIG